NRGTDSPWAAFFQIPEEVKAGGETEIKAWAARQVKAYYEGRAAAGMSYNVGDVVQQYKDLAAQKSLQEKVGTDALAQLAAEGITVDQSVLAQALGKIDYTAMASGVSGGFATAWADQDIWAEVASMKEAHRKELQASGERAGQDIASGALKALGETDFLGRMAEMVAPEVARILRPAGSGYQE
ncbi:MAG: hypothetical protein GX605_06115, partial [Chloroflexi bacterium]|nr:hypothetical protein [Chloroflexota bacterium]